MIVYPLAKLVVLQAFRQFKIAMTDSTKRILRERRPPKNFDSDNEHHDPWGYAKPTYSRPASQQELKNPAIQLNSEARLLLQFLCSINKKLRQYVAARPKTGPLDTRNAQTRREEKGKGAEFGEEGKGRGREERQEKIENVKRGKDQPHTIRAQINGGPIGYCKNETLLNEYKALNAKSAHNMLNIENSLKIKLEHPDPNLSKLQNNKRNTQNQLSNNIKTQQNTSKNLTKSASQAQTQGKLFGMANENVRQNDSANGKAKGNKGSISQNKIFKRSAYHIAIAYHIYLKKMRLMGAQGNEIDPTLHARRLRESLKK